jgi:YD repeat-containing protein
VPPGAIESKRAAVLWGSVRQRDNEPLAAVTITVLGRPEFGLTLTRADGLFDMAANGGGALTVNYEKVGFCPVQRQVNVPWRDYVAVPEVVMVPLDPVVTPVTFGTNAPPQVARGSEQTDDDGVRQATVVFPAGTCADLVMPDGTVIPCEGLSVRATEFTVGENGPASMPAELPPTSGYTYAVELSADEATATGAATIQFNQPVYNYVENFLGFPVGTAVPSGFYDREQGAWIASKNGRVIGVVSINEQLAELDTDGDGVADNDTSLGFTDAERQEIALLYQEGQSLWRVPITHFTPWDHNFPYGPAGEVIDPNLDLDADRGVNGCELLGSVVEVQNQVLRKSVPVVGTGFSLNFSSGRVAGYKEALSLNIPLISSTVPDSLKQIILQVQVAGRVFTELFPAAPDQETTFTWDGKDAYGRTPQGKQPVTVRLGYLYEPVYTEPAELEASFAALGGTAITGARGTGFAIWQEWRGLIGLWNAAAAGLGSWTLSAHHAQDTREAVIHMGTGVRYPVQSYEDVITTVAGTGAAGFSGDTGPAARARLSGPTDLAVGEDGSLYIADQGNNRIRRVDPDGRITTVAGTGNAGVFADGVPATEAVLNLPSSVAVGPDGSLYITDYLHNRIRRVFPGADGAVTGQPDETITTIAGTGVSGTTGDGGPAVQAQIQEVNAIAVAPDGSVYFAQQNNNVRVRRISPGGTITTITTGRSISGIAIGPNGAIYYTDSLFGTLHRVSSSGSSSVVANGLGSPWGVAVGPGSQLYFSTTLFRDRRVYQFQDGLPVEFAGTGAIGYSGDDGLALNAEMHTPLGLAVAPNGDVFIADSVNRVVRRVRRTLGGFATPLTPGPGGEEIFRFDSAGRHLQTLDSLTGAVLHRFEYDGYGLGAITDTFDNVTTIERNQEGVPLAIVSPFGQRTTLTVDANGYLEAVTNPANETVRMAHSQDGLLTSFIDARGNTSQYRSDGAGHLVETEDSERAVNAYSRTETNIGGSHVRTVSRTTALNRITTFRVEGRSDFDQKLITSHPSGEKSERVVSPSGSDVITFADGSVASLVFTADPRFGMQAPVPSSNTFDVSPGLRSTATVARTVDLRDPDDPLSLNGLTTTTTVNGQQSVVAYDDATGRPPLPLPLGVRRRPS